MSPRVEVGGADASLDAVLSAGLDATNGAATVDIAASRELTVQCRGGNGQVLAGVSGWTWAEAAGIGMVWVDPAERGAGLGSRLMDAFEQEARARGCLRVFVTSFTFQAPALYERRGYRVFARWNGIPARGMDDVHLVLEWH